ncbi:hypothetical protein COY27_06570 [Candidatus Woesearchaeota archaeon CG_4_10_14_0_2_um_filter_33_13]|nr:MAG: hypothetical protein COY27_06570 [Candidatus Woesearchaeota archaeon CG_4_10_14_0_2_um_filter_33_13]
MAYRITDTQERGMFICNIAAQTLVRELPEIADDYHPNGRGLTLKEIVQGRDLVNYLGLHSPKAEAMAINAVWLALGDLLGEERDTIGRSNSLASLRRYNDARRKPESLETIPVMTDSEKGTLGGKASVEARGLVAYVTAEEALNGVAELDYLRKLLEDQTYMHQKGHRVGMPDWKLITTEVNRVYHKSTPVRKAKPLRSAIYRSMIDATQK